MARDDEDATTLGDVVRTLDEVAESLEAMPVAGEMFAAAAMQGLLARGTEYDPHRLAAAAWDIADAMIEEEERRAALTDKPLRKPSSLS